MFLVNALDPRGRIKPERFRLFLRWYFFIFVPIFCVAFVALLTLGYQNPEGIVRNASLNQIYIVTWLYVLLCVWPLTAVSLRRLHDLGYRVRDVFFIISPKRSWDLGQEMLYREGIEKTNLFGKPSDL